ncbi:hypothetical protein Taro_008232 [Colocasia esculenta]|uniref:Uncharacterized protein n=1 Tax=Colocasia esculenta TaxID=4460 RepID=A0A843U1T0_COLES|nr:hypothetical protein [Colocasia esculenta]
MDNNEMSSSSEDMAWALLHADIFTSRMGVVSKLYCKIWQKDFVKLPVATKDLIFRDLQETMTQLMAPSSDIDAESHTPTTPEEAFISVMGKDRPIHVHCAGSGETLSTWYKSIAMSGNLERER